MNQFIRCPSCKFCFAPYVDFFDKAKSALYEEVVFGEKSEFRDHDPEKLTLNPGSTPALDELFDAIGIKNKCCRMRMNTKIEFDKLYK